MGGSLLRNSQKFPEIMLKIQFQAILTKERAEPFPSEYRFLYNILYNISQMFQ